MGCGAWLELAEIRDPRSVAGHLDIRIVSSTLCLLSNSIRNIFKEMDICVFLTGMSQGGDTSSLCCPNTEIGPRQYPDHSPHKNRTQNPESPTFHGESYS